MRRPLLLLALGLLALCVPSAAQAAYVDIGNASAKLTHVVASDTLTCQAQYAGDADGEFFSSSRDGAAPAQCGTALSVGGQLYGHPGPTPFTPVTQSDVEGTGASTSPRTVTTRVNAGTTGVQVEQTDSYVDGDNAYQSDIRVINSTGSDVAVRLYKTGDCYLQGADSGYGIMNADTGAIGCSANANNAPPGRVLGFLPISAGSFRFESQFSETNSKVIEQADLPNTCACTTLYDNGMAIGWSFTVPAGDSVVRSLLTFFSPEGALPNDTAPPTGLSVTKPASGSVTNQRLPRLEGTGSAAPGDLRVAYPHIYKGTEADYEKLVSAMEIPIDDSGHWGATWGGPALEDGVYTAVVRQEDASHNLGESRAVAFAVDTKAPAPTVTTPAAGTTVGQRPLLSGVAGNTAGDAAVVTVLLKAPDGVEHAVDGVKNDGGRWLYQPTADLAEGAWSIRARQADDAGNVGTSEPVAFTVAAGGTQFTGELPPVGTPATARETPTVTKTVSTRTKKRMPDLKGLRIDKARDALAKAGINIDLRIDEEGGSSSRYRIGEVMAQNPKKGKVVVSDAAHRARVSVKVFQGTKPGAKKCPAPGKLSKALKGMDLDVALRVLKADGCKVDLVVQTKAGGSSPEVGKVADGRGNAINVTVNVPRRPSGQDLFVIVRSAGGPGFPGMDVLDWALPANSGKLTALQVQVVDRAARFVQNANVVIDASAAGGRSTSTITAAQGEGNIASSGAIGVQVTRPGVVKVLVTARGTDQKEIYGFAQVRVKDQPSSNEWETTDGRSFLGGVCRVGSRNSRTSQGCVTNWVGGQDIPDGIGRTTVSGIGPSVDAASEGAYGRMAPLIADALSWNAPLVQMWQANRLSNANKMRNMSEASSLFVSQLVVQGGSPIDGNPVAGRQVSSTLNRVRGASEEHATGNQIPTTSRNVLAVSRVGLFTVSGGQGRVFDQNGGRYTVDARRAKVHTFDDGTSILDDGDTNPPWAAGVNGVLTIGQ